MGATAAQIASGRALAASRGYDPNLVDEGNADRANSAFPVQKSTSSTSSGSTSVASSAGSGLTAAPTVPATPNSQLPQSGGSVPGMAPAGAAGTASMDALNQVVEPTPDVQSGGSANASLLALSNLTGGGGSGGGGNQERVGSVAEESGGVYRALGRRNPPSGALVLRRKAY